MEVKIATLWNGEPITHDPVRFELEECNRGVQVTINAPFFDDPKPSGEPGKPFWLLWEYEVVELFFLNSATGEYLELEYCPHGQHIGLLFKKWRDFWKKNLELEFTSVINRDNKTWRGSALIPWDYFPVGVDKYNCYAMHGEGKSRQFQSLFPAPKDKHSEADFHRLEYFGDIGMKKTFPNGVWSKDASSIWSSE